MSCSVLLALVASLHVSIQVAARTTADAELAAGAAHASSEHHRWHPRTWYRDILVAPAEVSPDGAFLLYSSEDVFQLFEVRTRRLTPLAERLGWKDVSWATWDRTLRTHATRIRCTPTKSRPFGGSP
jgi:hypothetical protein